LTYEPICSIKAYLNSADRNEEKEMTPRKKKTVRLNVLVIGFDPRTDLLAAALNSYRPELGLDQETFTVTAQYTHIEREDGLKIVRDSKEKPIHAIILSCEHGKRAAKYAVHLLRTVGGHMFLPIFMDREWDGVPRLNPTMELILLDLVGDPI
jgi:hypothetical protein